MLYRESETFYLSVHTMYVILRNYTACLTARDMCESRQYQHAPEDHDAEEGNRGKPEDENRRIGASGHESSIRARKRQFVSENESLEVIVVVVERIPETEGREYRDRDVCFSRLVPERHERYHTHRIQEDALPPTEFAHRRLIDELEYERADD